MADETAVTYNDFTNEDTKTQIITDYEKLVKKLAIAFSRYGMDVEDLISEGNIGLMKAMEKYNPAIGAQFSIVAGIWIRCYMRKALSRHSKTIRIPARARCNLVRVRNARLTLKEKLGRKPTDLEIAEYLHISEKVVRGTKFADIRTLSIHNPLGEDGGDFQDVIPDDRPTPAQILAERETYDRLEAVVDALPAREKMVLQRRFGLDGASPESLQEIGLSMNYCSENVRVLETKALGRLRGMMQDEVEAVR